MTESRVWKTIDGFPDYEVSDCGEVRSWRRKARRWRNPHPGRRETPFVMSGFTDERGYRSVMLRDETGKVRRRTVHRLVAFAFLGRPASEHLTDVAHNDGNPSNNQVANLRWATHRENQMDMRRHGTMQDGEKCNKAKITEDIAREIHRRAQVRGEGVRLAEEFGLSRGQVSRIKNGSGWRHTLD